MSPAASNRTHLIVGGYPPGAFAGHDMDFARLRILELLSEAEVPATAAGDFTDIDKWLPGSNLLITYVAGPFADDEQAALIRHWIEEGGRWLGLHGTSGGKAVRTESRRRRMVKMNHHDTLGSFFLSHPPVRKFQVDVREDAHPLMRGLPTAFEVIDEPYMVEVQHPEDSNLLMTAALGPDTSEEGFGFEYKQDTSLLPDGQTRVIGYTRSIGLGEVAYTTLGHCHSPISNSQRYVDTSVDPAGKTPPTLRHTWETEAFQQLLRNGIAWGQGAG
jgi:type 1 glutamine amidotransferase